MSVLPAKHSSDFYEKFTEANKLYEEVKEIVIYAEYENKDQKYLISAVNELRNAFDHIMRIVSEPHSIDTNFEKARRHIYRAGYDAYEIIAISKLNNIKDVKEQFSYNAIIEAYPVSHSSVIPSVEKAKKELV